MADELSPIMPMPGEGSEPMGAPDGDVGGIDDPAGGLAPAPDSDPTPAPEEGENADPFGDEGSIRDVLGRPEPLNL